MSIFKHFTRNKIAAGSLFVFLALAGVYAIRAADAPPKTLSPEEHLKKVEGEYWLAVDTTGDLSDENKRQWRDRLASALEPLALIEQPTPVLGELLELSEALRDQGGVYDYSRRLANHPRANITTKMKCYYYLIQRLSQYDQNLDDQLRMFDELEAFIQNAPDLPFEKYTPEYRQFTLAQFLSRKAGILYESLSASHREPISKARCQAAVQAYDDYFRRVPQDLEDKIYPNGGGPRRCYALRNQAQILDRLGEYDRVAQNYRRILEHPADPWPASRVSYWRSLAECGLSESNGSSDTGPQAAKWRETVERALRELPRDEWTPALESALAWNYLRCGHPAKYVEWAVPILESADPNDRAYLAEGQVRARVLDNVVEAFVQLGDRDRAQQYVQRFSEDCPGSPYRLEAASRLTRLSRSESPNSDSGEPHPVSGNERR